MTVAELIEKLQGLPQGAEILTMVQGDYSDSPEVAVQWARRKGSEGWWSLFYGLGSPKFSMGYEEVVVIT